MWLPLRLFACERLGQAIGPELAEIGAGWIEDHAVKDSTDGAPVAVPHTVAIHLERAAAEAVNDLHVTNCRMSNRQVRAGAVASASHHGRHQERQKRARWC